MAELKINYSYPFHPDYYFESILERVNLDKVREESILAGRGFIVSDFQSNIKKDLRNPNGIFSTKFGQTLQDVNPFADRYRCECGHMTSRIHHGITCKICGTKVRFVDDDFGFFGWVVLKDPYYVMHPNLYKAIAFFLGEERLNDILLPKDDKDQDGYSSKKAKEYKKEPYHGLGILDFKEKFEEIMNYYLTKIPNKKDYHEDIMKNKDKVFTQSIPVYTTHLRPYTLNGDRLVYEGTNAIYNMICKLSVSINNDDLRIFRKKKPKNQLLYDMNGKFQELYKELESVISGKKGSIRTLFGGRYNFTSRCVIVPNPKLRIDEVVMPYSAMVELMQQSIINVLQKSYNMSYSDAHNMWFKAQTEKSERVEQIIRGLIKTHKRGVPVLINRNPTIAYGGILQMFVVDITDTYTLGLPLQILPLLAGDFDGDVLNVLYIINETFFDAAYRIFNPRNAMYISRNDGKMNNDVNHTKDLLINGNTMIGLARDSYSPEQLAKIAKIKQMTQVS